MGLCSRAPWAAHKTSRGRPGSLGNVWQSQAWGWECLGCYRREVGPGGAGRLNERGSTGNLGGERLALAQGPDWRWAGNPDGGWRWERGPEVVDEGAEEE